MEKGITKLTTKKRKKQEEKERKLMNSSICCRSSTARCFTVLFLIWTLSLLLLLITAQIYHPLDNSNNNSNDDDNKNHHVGTAGLIQRQKKIHASISSHQKSSSNPNNKKNNNNNNPNSLDFYDNVNNRGYEGQSVIVSPLYLQRKQKLLRNISSMVSKNSRDKVNCFAVVVSNEEYLDGVLVLGVSLLQQSKLAKQNNNEAADLVVIIPEGALSDESIDRLFLAGWTHVFQVEDLAKKAPRAHWAGTFNKLYLFNLTQYALVAFFDADMLMRSNPDYIFETTTLKDYHHIGALGNSLFDRHGKARPAYFQTGMMLLIPSEVSFKAMMDDFYNSPDSRNVNGRDGLIIRRYFGKNYKNLDDALSVHVATQNEIEWVTGLHFRGGFKPWFNKAKVSPYDKDEVHRLKKKAKEKKIEFVMPQKGKWLEIGPAYTLWWETYEKFHNNVLMEYDLKRFPSSSPSPSSPSSSPQDSTNNNNENDANEKEEDSSSSSSSSPPKGYDPSIHVWLQRHSKKSYIQLKSNVAQKLRTEAAEQKKKLKGYATEIIVSEKGKSCDLACSSSSSKRKHDDEKNEGEEAKQNKIMKCDDDLLQSSELQSCKVFQDHLLYECDGRKKHRNKCKYHGVAAKSTQPDSSSCAINSMLNPYSIPLCNASEVGVARICLCHRTASMEDLRKAEEESSKNRNQNQKDADDDQQQEQEQEDHHHKRHHHHHHHEQHKHHHKKQEQKIKDEEEEPQQHSDNNNQQQQNHHHHHLCQLQKFKLSSSNSHKKLKSTNLETTDGIITTSESCISRLQDTSNEGSWSIQEINSSSSTSSSLKKNTKRNVDDDDEENISSKTPPIFSILARYRDGNSQNTIWFPHRNVPELVEKVLLSHFVARLLKIQWVPVTTLQTYSLKEIPKKLTKLLQRQQQQKVEETKEEQQKRQKQQKKHVEREIISYLGPSLCPEVFSDGDFGWKIYAATNWHDSASSSSSDDEIIFNKRSALETGQATLLFYLLGVPFNQETANFHFVASSSSSSKNKRRISWEFVIQQMNSVTSTKDLVSEIPRCAMLKAAKESTEMLLLVEKSLNLLTGTTPAQKHKQFLDMMKVNYDVNDSDNDSSEDGATKQQQMEKKNEEGKEQQQKENEGGKEKEEEEIPPKYYFDTELWKFLHDAATWKFITRKSKSTLEKIKKRVQEVRSLVAKCR